MTQECKLPNPGASAEPALTEEVPEYLWERVYETQQCYDEWAKRSFEEKRRAFLGLRPLPAAEVVGVLAADNNCYQTPTTESQARELAPLASGGH